jgi:hypothetical protein
LAMVSYARIHVTPPPRSSDRQENTAMPGRRPVDLLQDREKHYGDGTARAQRPTRAQLPPTRTVSTQDGGG